MVNLIPQLRADKNGKLVTRNVRAEAKPVKGRSSMPKPEISTPSAQVVDKQSDPLKPFKLGPFNWYGSDAVVTAIQDQYKIDTSSQVELTSVQWLEARRRGLQDKQIHSFIIAGVTDPDEMLEFAQKHDRSLLPNIKPGLHRKREKWVDELIAGGVTHEEFKTANSNFGSYGILTVLNDFDFTGNAADMVRMYAEYPNRSTRETINNFLYDGKMSLDEVKTFGVTRLKKYGELVSDYLKTENPIPLDELAELIKGEEKRGSVLTDNNLTKVNSRLSAVKRWGLEKSLEIREPHFLFGAGIGIHRAIYGMEPDELFAFAKHHDEVLHLSILRKSHEKANDDHAYTDALPKIKEYSHIADNAFYNPKPERTIDYFKMGLTPQDTIEALEIGASAVSARGIKEGATAAVADGWL